jgi:REase_AHJR-like protein
MISKSEHVRGIAERYVREGYQVAIEPTGTLMPPPLSWLQADLVAWRHDERVLVLIEGADEQLQLVADVINRTTGWRLDVDRLEEKSAQGSPGR